ncbi:MAG TPA: hypothetical protein VMZ71_04255 [Gemmataceae bacterium]|nr:hypothetical protein [Gemmataceae bacterium]
MKLPAWLESVSPGHLARFLLNEASPRKSGLFIRHLCRCFPDVFSDPRTRAALDAADALEAGEIAEDEFARAIRAAGEAGAQPPGVVATAEGYAAQVAGHTASVGFYPGVLASMRSAVLAHEGAGRGPRKNPTARAMRPVFFEHFGDPKSPVELDPLWRSSTVRALANGVYADRAFDRLPILADALMDAGCGHADILDHCRSDSPHVRGCWVVDLLLGKG